MAVEHSVWGDAELLQANRLQLRRNLKRKLRRYECQFEFSSDRVESELAGGRLRETADVCDWVIALRTLRTLDR
ncbi:MAG: hypothetical protein ACKVVP_04690 [Chloroflexota bacterium]